MRRSTPRRLSTAAVAVLGGMALAQPIPPALAAPAGERQQAFAEAAADYGVPQSVLLGVSYLESRWDANAGRPSTSAGFGPMHLTDAAALAATPHHHSERDEDPRGDSARLTMKIGESSTPAAIPAALRTLERAAVLTGESRGRLRADPTANIRGGAALLADYQKGLGAPLSDDPAQWYGAVAKYSGASDTASAAAFADEVYAVIAAGAERVTGDGQRVHLDGRPGVKPLKSRLGELRLRTGSTDGVDCPHTLPCEWLPAPYEQLSDGKYGNHDLADLPRSHYIDYIVILYRVKIYATTVRLDRDPAYVSWHYTLRSNDGHIAQHVRTKDVAWHAGNWYVNAKSIGVEHEGFLAQGGSWYTEAMYRTSAKLVRYLARRYAIPLDRAHIIGHDNVPGTTPSTVAGMHEDPGPYWDWAHYFELLGRPLRPAGNHPAGDQPAGDQPAGDQPAGDQPVGDRPETGAKLGSVMIRPDYATNQAVYTGCDAANPAAACPPHGSSSVWLRTEPRQDAPLVRDIGKHPEGESLTSVYDHSARASTGQRYVVADRRGDWTAIWYLGQKAWFFNPADRPTAVRASGPLVTPKPGQATVPVYGRAYPEPDAYPEGVPVQQIEPLQYTFSAGQAYTLGLAARSEYYRSVTFDSAQHVVVRGKLRYYQIQFGHRVMFVRADDVQVLPA
jgi:hypothetical protein